MAIKYIIKYNMRTGLSGKEDKMYAERLAKPTYYDLLKKSDSGVETMASFRGLADLLSSLEFDKVMKNKKQKDEIKLEGFFSQYEQRLINKVMGLKSLKK